VSVATAPERLDLVAPAPAPSAAAHGGRWAALAIIAVAQLMVVLDATIVNIALPQAQADLGISDVNRSWVVTAYTLTFGGLLLLGGRIADYWGRKRTFVLGIIGFAVASALGGIAQNGETLFAARALQGVFGALLAPASLALLSVMFTDAKERAKAFGVYGGIAAGGAAVGLLLGGVLTEYTDWRWCLLVNIPIALLALPFALRLVPESKAEGNTRYDIPGAVLVTAGLISLVYGFTKAGEDGGWNSPGTIGLIVAAVVLLVAFVVWETRAKNPLLPLRILLDGNRGGAYLASTLVGVGFIGATLFLTYYFQGVLGYSPVEAGLASLPLSAGVLVAAGFASAMLPKVGPRVLMTAGGLISAAGMLLLTRLGVDTGFASHVLPAELLLGAGLGLVFVPMGNVALVGVAEHDAGAASAVVNASQQVGGSLGVALLSTIALSATSSWASANMPATPPAPTTPLDPTVAEQLAKAGEAAAKAFQAQALVHGFQVGFTWAAAILALSAVVTAVFIRAGKDAVASDQTSVHFG
jgi:EmrB/QacA subfamily drug resistance transporter